MKFHRYPLLCNMNTDWPTEMAIEETVLLLFWLIFKSFLSKNTQPDPDFKGVTQK